MKFCLPWPPTTQATQGAPTWAEQNLRAKAGRSLPVACSHMVASSAHQGSEVSTGVEVPPLASWGRLSTIPAAAPGQRHLRADTGLCILLSVRGRPSPTRVGEERGSGPCAPLTGALPL